MCPRSAARRAPVRLAALLSVTLEIEVAEVDLSGRPLHRLTACGRRASAGYRAGTESGREAGRAARST